MFRSNMKSRETNHVLPLDVFVMAYINIFSKKLRVLLKIKTSYQHNKHSPMQISSKVLQNQK